eukprot:Amastigsp_a176078_30.p4 type:complete len:109 gc:universal Amastigsp_a176078_30:647-973(+)
MTKRSEGSNWTRAGTNPKDSSSPVNVHESVALSQARNESANVGDGLRVAGMRALTSALTPCAIPALVTNVLVTRLPCSASRVASLSPSVCIIEAASSSVLSGRATNAS